MPTNRKISHNKKNPWTAILGVCLLVLLGSMTGLVLGAVRTLPTWDPNKLLGSETSIIFDDQGHQVTKLHAAENRIFVALKDIPPHFINAVIATEDQDFYRHHGISLKRIAGALIVNLTRQSKAQGASTITQQLARVSFLYPEKTYERKIKEILLAFQLESKYSKDEILEFYLNKVYFGSGAYGVQAAAQTYFGKDVQDLNLSESAMLAGIIQSPGRLSPFANYDLAKKRQQIVLNNMVRCGYISQQEANNAFDQPLSFRKSLSSESRYGYFIDSVIEEADEILHGYYENPQYALYNEGLRIYTTMDSEVQKYAEEVYDDPSFFPPAKSRKGQDVQSAMVLLDHHTGEVKAIIGGRKYEQKRGFNRAIASLRHPGSAFKPVVVYGPALEQGYMPFYVLDDSPVTYTTPAGSWSPENYDGKYRGLITMRTAVQWSVNVYAVKLAELVGIKNGIAFAEKLGISSLVTAGEKNDMGLATALGGLTKGVSPLELTAAYGCFANNGVYVKPHTITKITTAEGHVIYTYHPQYRRVMKPTTAWLMTSMLQTVVQAGTGTRAQIPGIPCAGKTGTSQDLQNAWFVGYTPNYTCGVWMGYDQLERMYNVAGGTYPARIWKSVMVKALEGETHQAFVMPKGIVSVQVCNKSGSLPCQICPDKCIISDYATSDNIPDKTCDRHVLFNICPDSGKLATEYCPFPIPKAFVNVAEDSRDPDKPPTEYCNIHSASQITSELVPVCKDSRHGNRIFRANIPGLNETGGCPSSLVVEEALPKGADVPLCPLPDHQVQPR